MKHAEDGLKQTLSASPDCLPLERLTETLTEQERQHVESCSRCQTELQLWQEFEQSEPAHGEGAAVQWIVAELGRRNATATEKAASRRLAWLVPSLRRWATAAAAVMLVAIVGYLAWDREPAVRERSGTNDVYRTGQVQVVRPVGDLTSAPETLEWVALPDAVRYDIEVLEVDRTALWRTTSTTPRVDLPSEVVRKLVPGKTILWEVRARNAASSAIAESGTQRFRVQLTR